MWQKLLQRLREPSTHAGLAAVTLGIGQLAKINEAPAIADAITSAGTAAQADPVVGVAALVFGLVAIFRKG